MNTLSFASASAKPVSGRYVLLGALALLFAPVAPAGPVPENPDPSRLVWIPPGTFTMGSPSTELERDTDEKRHTVTLSSGFFMRRSLVTQTEYLAVTGSNPSQFGGSPSLPVDSATWAEATNYCALLTQREGAAGRLPADWIYRLPTESEWEYACRAGTTTPFYFGSSLVGGMLNFDSHYEYDSSVGEVYVENPSTFLDQPVLVESYPPNPWGLYDMSGNAWNWCSDWYGPYASGSVTNPVGHGTGTKRVIRGGSWISHAFRCRSAGRYPLDPGWRGYNVSFRPVLAPGPSGGPPVILAQPESVAAPAGTDVAFSVSASGGQLAYQWRCNGTEIPGATGSYCLLPDVGLDSAGSYSVVITNSFGRTNSNVAVLTVKRTWQSGLDLHYTEGAATMPYRLYLPKDYSPATSYPLVLFLHEGGSCGSDNVAQVEGHIAGLIERTYSDYPALLLAPQVTGGDQYWSPRCAADLTLGILAQVRQHYAVDERRIYLTGLSMGGFGVTEYACYSPGFFAAMAPISGADTLPPSAGTRLSRLPTWLFHGSADTTFPVECSRRYYTNVTGLAAIDFTQSNYGYLSAVAEPIRYTELTDMGQDIGELIYAGASTDLYDWMFSQIRPSATITCAAASSAGEALVLRGTSDVPLASACLLSSTNFLAPLSEWRRVATNWFDAGGWVVFTNTLVRTDKQRFFILQSP